MTYSTWAEAEAALRGVDGHATLPGGSHPIAVKFADAKPVELAKFEARGTKRNSWEMGTSGGGGVPGGGVPGGGVPGGGVPGDSMPGGAADIMSGGSMAAPGAGGAGGSKRQVMGGMAQLGGMVRQA